MPAAAGQRTAGATSLPRDGGDARSLLLGAESSGHHPPGGASDAGRESPASLGEHGTGRRRSPIDEVLPFASKVRHWVASPRAFSPASPSCEVRNKEFHVGSSCVIVVGRGAG